MVQCLILFQYLNSFTEAAKVKQAATLGSNLNRSLLLPYKLSEADVRRAYFSYLTLADQIP